MMMPRQFVLAFIPLFIHGTAVRIDGLSSVTGEGNSSSDSASYYTSIKALQYSPHGECFDGWGKRAWGKQNRCGKEALGFINKALRPIGGEGKDAEVDFASVIYVPEDVIDEEKLDKHGGSWGVIDQHCPAKYEDSATLIYNKNKWHRLEGHEIGECIDGRNRNKPYAVVMQGFKLKNDKNAKPVVVMAAHLPHDKYHHHLDDLKKEIHAYMHKLDGQHTRFILLTDSNEPTSRSMGKDILDMLGVPLLDGKKSSSSTDGFYSCCYPSMWVTGYDRIIANFGSMESTVTDLLSQDEIDTWLGDKHNMHLPVLGYLKVQW